MAIHHIDSAHYGAQLKAKHQLMLQEFSRESNIECEVYQSEPIHFRMRAEFKVWHEGNQCHFAMFTPGQYKAPFIIDRFDPGSKQINQLMPKLLKQINANELLRRKCFQVEFLTSTLGQCLITMIYHKPLDQQWIDVANELQKTLQCKIIGRSKKQKVVLDTDWIEEEFTVADKVYNYRHVEASFTQPNASICQHMLNWAFDQTIKQPGDLLELYCGNGNFTLPLSQNFNKVLATEISKSSVNAAIANIERNQIDNLHIVRMSSEEITEALNKTREFRRLQAINLDDYNFSTVLVDPPRAGLDAKTLELVSRFEMIVYISCNPETLKSNIKSLEKSHHLTKLALFDQFPYTDHRECGAILRQV